MPIGGFVAVNDPDLALSLREQVVVYEGFPHYGGIAGHGMEALAQGIRESTDERIVRAYVDTKPLWLFMPVAGIPVGDADAEHGTAAEGRRGVGGDTGVGGLAALALGGTTFLGCDDGTTDTPDTTTTPRSTPVVSVAWR